MTPLFAPTGCAAPIVIDRDSLRRTGAVTLKVRGNGFVLRTARTPGEDRPWSRAPKARWGAAAPKHETGADAALSTGE